MKILLIIPNTNSIYRCIRLGPLYIASALRSSDSNYVNIIDARREGLGKREIARRIQEFSPDVIGIPGVSVEAFGIHELARLVKATDKKCKVVVGGPYAFSSPEFIIRDPNIDFVVIGEGERTTCELISALENNRDLSEIKGIAFKNNGEPVITPPRPIIENLDAIPFPAWDLIDMERYFFDAYPHTQTSMFMYVSGRIAPLFTSRGCPYGCTYCHRIFGKHLRFRSVRNVIEEIEILVTRYGVEEIEVLDDCFNFDPSRAKEICDEITRRNLKVKLFFSNGLRVDRMDDELIVKLKKAGTQGIVYAIESASADIQRKIGKNLDLEKAKQIIHKTAQHGILVGGYFMLGFPGETKEQMLNTIQFAKELPFYHVNFFYVTPVPNTALFEELRIDSRKIENVHAGLYRSLTLNLSAVSDRQLKHLWRRAHREFYLRPSQIWRMWRMMPYKKIALRIFFVFIPCFLFGINIYGPIVRLRQILGMHKRKKRKAYLEHVTCNL